MIHIKSFPLLLISLLFGAFTQVKGLSFDYPGFPSNVGRAFELKGQSYIVYNALQVTMDVRGASINNLSGRVLHKKRYKLWKKGRVASFNTTFVLNITPESDPGGEGLAFILTRDSEVPNSSDGQWLGIVNASSNGSSQNDIVAIEFDTKKSFLEDIDNNHVGVDVDSVYSIKQVPLGSIGVNISSAQDVTAKIIYDGVIKTLTVFVSMGNDTRSTPKSPVISMPLDLSRYLPEKVYMGFSASTGATSSELNCVKAWNFNGVDIEGKRVWVWILISVISVILLCGVVAVIYVKNARKRKRINDESLRIDEEIMQGSGLGPKKYQFKELKAATANFSVKNELGKGGFGVVYKGILNDTEVAIKRVTKNTQQGKRNLIAEVTTIGNLHHKNLVKLIGWCHESDELLLVYEFMPNRSLDKFLYHNEKEPNVILNWEKRHNIIRGVAQALDYLHNECSQRVLHRDIKVSNIMLDSEFNACLGDFGLARMFKLSEKTHHSTKELAGTPGYMAPELFHTGRATTETDVYAFGVLALVLTCGRKPGIENDLDEFSDSIVNWVWEFYKLEIVTDAVDPKLNGEFDREQAECLLLLGLSCCHPNPNMRPSMRSALQILMGEALPPLVPFEKPAFIGPATPPSFTREDSVSGGMLTPFSTLSGR